MRAFMAPRRLISAPIPCTATVSPGLNTPPPGVNAQHLDAGPLADLVDRQRVLVAGGQGGVVHLHRRDAEPVAVVPDEGPGLGGAVEPETISMIGISEISGCVAAAIAVCWPSTTSSPSSVGDHGRLEAPPVPGRHDTPDQHDGLFRQVALILFVDLQRRRIDHGEPGQAGSDDIRHQVAELKGLDGAFHGLFP
jgi:hypothetical protein